MENEKEILDETTETTTNQDETAAANPEADTDAKTDAENQESDENAKSQEETAGEACETQDKKEGKKFFKSKEKADKKKCLYARRGLHLPLLLPIFLSARTDLRSFQQDLLHRRFG